MKPDLFKPAIFSAQAAVNSASTESERQLAYAIGQLAQANEAAFKDLYEELYQLRHAS